MEPVTIIGYVAAVFGTICWVPQLAKIWISRETKDLSLWANLLMLTNLTLWMTYGLLLGAWPLFIANLISILLVGSIVTAKLTYK